jgi:hypothetical protein
MLAWNAAKVAAFFRANCIAARKLDRLYSSCSLAGSLAPETTATDPCWTDTGTGKRLLVGADIVRVVRVEDR